MQCEAFEEFQAMEQYGFIYIFKCFTLAVALRMIWDKKKILGDLLDRGL